MQQKGFTLIELLIVIAIIAVLSVVVVLTLNPAELLRQARDSARVSDMSSMDSALSLFLADGGTFSRSDTCYAFSSSTATSCGTAALGMGFNSASLTTVNNTGSSSRATTGAGWLPVNFASSSAGAPFGTLPVDPTNNSSYFYAFAAGSSSTYKLNARMESTKYSTGTTNVMLNSKDGGTSDSLYEKGNTLSL